MPTSPPIVRAVDLSRTFGHGDGAVDALVHVSVGFPAGGFTAIMGPSGSGKSTLNSNASAEVLGLLRRAADEFGQTIVMVTHDASAASYADRLVLLADGRIVRDQDAGDTDSVLELMKTAA